jgi:hypothetical protein
VSVDKARVEAQLGRKGEALEHAKKSGQLDTSSREHQSQADMQAMGSRTGGEESNQDDNLHSLQDARK